LSGQKVTVDYSQVNKVVLTHVLSTVQSFTMQAVPNASIYGQDVVFTATAVPDFGATEFPTGEVVDFRWTAAPLSPCR